MTNIPSVEDYSIDITSDLTGVLSSDLYDELENRTIKGLTNQRIALLTELREWAEAEPTINDLILKERLLNRINNLINPTNI